MADGGSIATWAYDVGLEAIASAANGILCGTSPLKLSDIPGMVDGSSSYGSGLVTGLRSLVLVSTATVLSRVLASPAHAGGRAGFRNCVDGIFFHPPQGTGHVGVKSAWQMAKAVARHPECASDFLSQLTVVPNSG